MLNRPNITECILWSGNPKLIGHGAIVTCTNRGTAALQLMVFLIESNNRCCQPVTRVAAITADAGHKVDRVADRRAAVDIGGCLCINKG